MKQKGKVKFADFKIPRKGRRLFFENTISEDDLSESDRQIFETDQYEPDVEDKIIRYLEYERLIPDDNKISKPKKKSISFEKFSELVADGKIQNIVDIIEPVIGFKSELQQYEEDGSNKLVIKYLREVITLRAFENYLYKPYNFTADLEDGSKTDDNSSLSLNEKVDYARRLSKKLKLTKMQATVLVWLFFGVSESNVGKILGVSRQAVEGHLNRIKAKSEKYLSKFIKAKGKNIRDKT